MKRFLLCVLLAGCAQPSGQVVRTETDQYTTVGTLDGVIRSINHDNHLYVVATTVHGVSIIHSPACPCLLKAEHENH